MDGDKHIPLGLIGTDRLQLRTALVQARHGFHHIQCAVGEQIRKLIKLLLLTGRRFARYDLLVGIHHVINQPGRHRTRQIFHGFLVESVGRQPFFVMEHRLRKLPVLFLMGFDAAVMDGFLIRFLIPEVINHIVLQKSQNSLVDFYSRAFFDCVYQFLRHPEQLHMLLVNPIYPDSVGVFPHHALLIPLLQKTQFLIYFIMFKFI